MKTFRVTYRDEDGVLQEKIYHAKAIDLDLGQVIMDDVDAEYDCDSQTDGTDVWYIDDNGDYVTVMSDMEEEEIEEE